MIAGLQKPRANAQMPGGVVLCAALAVVLTANHAAAQPAPSVSQAVVQQVPGMDGLSLNAALARLAQNPRDVDALIDAGRAAQAMGDFDAAVGFYKRAGQEAPANPRVKAGLAGALVRSGNPFDAIPLFSEAERGGPIDPALIAERGLAYDLVGDHAVAQRYYQAALARESSDEVRRRLALSQAMAGDKTAAETTLAPLLARQDKAAFRTRAFALAILGQTEDAVGIAYASLPADLAAAISPYLRYIPRLTPAQQAAAANFGQFPRASEIGRDDPRVAAFAPAGGRRPALASADSALIPKGEPLGRKSRRTARSSERPVEGDGSGRTIDRPSSRERGTLAVASPAPRRTAPPDVQATREVSATPEAVSLVPPQAPPVRQAQAALPVATPPAITVPDKSPPAPVQTPSAQPVPGVQQAARVATMAQATPPVTPPASVPAASLPVASGPAASGPAVAAPVAGPPAPMPVPVPAPATVPSSAPGFATLDQAGTQPPASFDLARVSTPPSATPSPTPAPTPTTVPTTVPTTTTTSAPAEAAVSTPPSKPASLAEAFSEFASPAVDTAPAAGAVDIRRIRPVREGAAATSDKPVQAKPARPAPPSHPSRIWVQVATGRDKAALGFDWRRMTRQAADAFRGKSAMVSAWGQTNRLLAGPFPSEAAANAFMAQLRKADIDGSFIWTSPAGQVVDALPAR